MTSMMTTSQQGHSYQLHRIFVYLEKHHNAEIVFDPSIPSFNDSDFPRQDQESTPFGTNVEIIPKDTPEERGFGFYVSAFADSDHAGDMITCWSRTGYIVFVNNSPVSWYSKKQGGIETSSFLSEFVALKTCCKYICGLRYKLRMMGITVMGHSYIYSNNKSVLSNTSVPDSVISALVS